MATLAPLLHPRLRALAPAQRKAALRRAHRTSFDTFELVGMAAGLVAASLAARWALAHWLVGMGAAAELGVAALAVALAVGPFVFRRTRRGLRDVLGEPGSP
jgi:hypothetical protein